MGQTVELKTKKRFKEKEKKTFIMHKFYQKIQRKKYYIILPVYFFFTLSSLDNKVPTTTRLKKFLSNFKRKSENGVVYFIRHNTFGTLRLYNNEPGEHSKKSAIPQMIIFLTAKLFCDRAPLHSKFLFLEWGRDNFFNF